MPVRPRSSTVLTLALALLLAPVFGSAAAAGAPSLATRTASAPEAPSLTAGAERGYNRISVIHEPWDHTYRVLRAEGSGREREVAVGVDMPWEDPAPTPGVRYTYRVRAEYKGELSPPSDPTTLTALGLADGNDGELVPIEPVRVLDTRSAVGAPARPLGPRGTLTFDPGLDDAIPAEGVSAVLLNLTGTEPTRATHVRAWPTGDPVPGTSSLNLAPGQTRANQVVVPLGADGTVSLYNDSGDTHLVVDVQGFYATADGQDGGGYHAGESHRILDTRLPGRGSLLPRADGSLGEGPLGAYEEIWLPMRELRWADVTAVEINITVTEPTLEGHLVVWPGGPGRWTAPHISNVNFVAGQTIPNHAVVPVAYRESPGDPGITIRHNGIGRAHVVVDLLGWYDDGSSTTGLRFHPTETQRVADTRIGTAPVGPGQTLLVPIPGHPEAVAHVVNLTATQSTGPGHLIAGSGDSPPPGTSVVNYQRGEDSPNLATVPAGVGGRIGVTAGTSSAHVIVDHVGYFS